MTRQIDLFAKDVCERNHKGNRESKDAFNKIQPQLSALQEKVLEHAKYLCDNDYNVTVKIMRADLNMEHQTASARLTELKRMELLRPTDKRDDGCRVLEITELGRRTLTQWKKGK